MIVRRGRRRRILLPERGGPPSPLASLRHSLWDKGNGGAMYDKNDKSAQGRDSGPFWMFVLTENLPSGAPERR